MHQSHGAKVGPAWPNERGLLQEEREEILESLTRKTTHHVPGQLEELLRDPEIEGLILDQRISGKRSWRESSMTQKGRDWASRQIQRQLVHPASHEPWKKQDSPLPERWINPEMVDMSLIPAPQRADIPQVIERCGNILHLLDTSGTQQREGRTHQRLLYGARTLLEASREQWGESGIQWVCFHDPLQSMVHSVPRHEIESTPPPAEDISQLPALGSAHLEGFPVLGLHVLNSWVKRLKSTKGGPRDRINEACTLAYLGKGKLITRLLETGELKVEGSDINHPTFSLVVSGQTPLGPRSFHARKRAGITSTARLASTSRQEAIMVADHFHPARALGLWRLMED